MNTITRPAANLSEEEFVEIDGKMWLVLFISSHADTRRIDLYLADENDVETIHRCGFDDLIEVI